MTSPSELVLLAWAPIGLIMFLGMKPWKAVLANFIIGWLFLPVDSINLDGLPDVSKILAISLTCMLGVALFDARTLTRFRFRWFDIPIVVFSFSAIMTSLVNELGLWDGLSSSLAIVSQWLIPYVIGRLYFSDRIGVQRLAMAVFIGGLVYMPFCLLEIRMSPFLHKAFYGGHARASFGQTKRWGGYRPTVFMTHGLMVGLWMTSSTICGYWLMKCKSLRQLWGIPVGWWVAALAVTTVLCKSFGALALLGLAIVLLRVGARRGPVAMRLLITLIPIYMAARIAGWDGHQFADFADMISKERGGSLRYRLEMEVSLLMKAMQQPWFGWGGWARSRVFTWRGVDKTVADSTWIIVLGQKGILGLASLTTTLLLPLVRRTWPGGLRRMVSSDRAGEAALSLVVLVYAYDCLVNAMHNPVYAIAIGAIAGVVGARPSSPSSHQTSRTKVRRRTRNASSWRIPMAGPDAAPGIADEARRGSGGPAPAGPLT